MSDATFCNLGTTLVERRARDEVGSGYVSVAWVTPEFSSVVRSSPGSRANVSNPGCPGGRGGFCSRTSCSDGVRF